MRPDFVRNVVPEYIVNSVSLTADIALLVRPVVYIVPDRRHFARTLWQRAAPGQ